MTRQERAKTLIDATRTKYIEANFKCDKSGNLCHIRSGCFNGNGLLEPICVNNLEDLWAEAKEQE